MIRFNELKAGTNFRFNFDWAGGWEYRKVGENRIRQIGCPRTEKGNGNEFDISGDSLISVVTILPANRHLANSAV